MTEDARGAEVPFLCAEIFGPDHQPSQSLVTAYERFSARASAAADEGTLPLNSSGAFQERSIRSQDQRRSGTTTPGDEGEQTSLTIRGNQIQDFINEGAREAPFPHP